MKQSPKNNSQMWRVRSIICCITSILIGICLLSILSCRGTSLEGFGIQDNLGVKLNIAIIIVVDPNSTEFYVRALDSVRCYSQIHEYPLIIAESAIYTSKCPHKDQFFKRHCVVSQILPDYDYALFIDADIGVVNPKRKIENYIDPNFDIILYDRFWNWEIMAGSYLVRNSDYGLNFLKGTLKFGLNLRIALSGFADYEFRLPKSFHGTDNGAIEAYVAEMTFPSRPDVYEPCREIWRKSESWEHVFVYEACIRAALGAREDFPHIKILRKGSAWARDCWSTNSVWDPNRDFMFHAWKSNHLGNYAKEDLPIKPSHLFGTWYDPTIGNFDLKKCIPGNTTWNHDPNLISTSGEVQQALDGFRDEVSREYYRNLARIQQILKY